MINLLILIGIFIFSIYPTMAKNTNYLMPASSNLILLRVLKNAQTSASTLKKLLDKGQSENFFKEATMELERIRKEVYRRKEINFQVKKISKQYPLDFFILSPIHLFLP